MTNADHERERRAFWDACCAGALEASRSLPVDVEAHWASELATAKLAERDKMFPAPVEDVAARTCGSCKHRNTSTIEPCGSCVGYARWESR